ncbi:GNAT family N-acetyltransferase [Nonomuraea sediminis]|uniref:GNAT family N-acetyltransferase n=1 Tax=Nonomuraea sediminis TaxID=2835864 RepID=UPI00355727DE
MRVACSKKLHVITADDFVIRTAGYWALRAAKAAGSDEHAQRWLGWPLDMVREYESSHGKLLDRELDDESEAPSPGWFALINRHDRRIMGALVIAVSQLNRVEIGGYLAPQYRGRGFGAQLFTLGSVLAHTHLGLPEIYAGTETGNIACRQSLLKAGFTYTDGPAQHTLPNGRMVDSVWFKSAVAREATCRPRWLWRRWARVR